MKVCALFTVFTVLQLGTAVVKAHLQAPSTLQPTLLCFSAPYKHVGTMPGMEVILDEGAFRHCLAGIAGAMPLPVHIEREVIPASEIPLPRKIEPAESSQPQNLCISSSTSSSSSRVDSSSDTEKDSSLETGTGNSSQPCRRPPTSSLHNPATSSVALGGATQCSQAAAVGKAVAGVAAMGTGSAAGVGRGATSSSNRGCLLVAAAVDVGSSSCSQVGDLKGRCWRSSWGDERQQQEEGNPAAFWADYDFAPKPEYCKQYERERQNDAIAPEDVWEVLSRPQSSSDASGASDVNLKEKVHDRNMLCISSTLLHETASGVEHPKLPNSSHSSRMTDVIPKQERTNSSDSGCCMQGQGDGNITTATAGNLLYDELIVDWAMPAVNVRVCDDIYDLRVLAPRKATKHSSKAPGSAAAKGNNRGAQKPAAPFLKALRLLEYSLYSSSLAKAPKKASDDIRVPDNVNARSVLLGLVARLFKR